MKQYVLSICAAWAAMFLTSCNDCQQVEEEQRAFDKVGVRPLLPPDEYTQQRNMIERVNRCLGLLEFASGVTDEAIRTELKRRGITEITSREIRPLLTVATEVVRSTSLPEDEVADIVAEVRQPIRSTLQIRQRLDEIGECAELSRRAAQKPEQ